MLHLLRGFLPSLFAGFFSALIWALIRHFGHVELGFAACFIGAFVGLAAIGGSRHYRTSRPAGAMAAIIALLAVFGGKYFDIVLQVQEAFPFQKIQSFQVTDAIAVQHMARTIAQEYERDGKPLDWPAGKSLANAKVPPDFPPDVLSETRQRYSAMTPVERMRYRNDLEAKMRAATETRAHLITQRAFSKAAFSGLSLLWYFLAATTAFGIATGRRPLKKRSRGTPEPEPDPESLSEPQPSA